MRLALRTVDLAVSWQLTYRAKAHRLLLQVVIQSGSRHSVDTCTRLIPVCRQGATAGSRGHREFLGGAAQIPFPSSMQTLSVASCGGAPKPPRAEPHNRVRRRILQLQRLAGHPSSVPGHTSSVHPPSPQLSHYTPHGSVPEGSPSVGTCCNDASSLTVSDARWDLPPWCFWGPRCRR